ncbi:MAG: 2-hydroxyacyl-CoA dehydratase [Chloroflexi bacterium]|nr:2-hydroxyacyl-CoA dehydratase [Chloroflexota bacterium]
MTTIGITTTVPIEVLLAAGLRPRDLNNRFIAHPQRERLLAAAERDGFPLNCCAWIKGLYAICLEEGLERVLCVTTGDCSNTQMLMEVLRLRGVETIPFAFPEQPDPEAMAHALAGLARRLGATMAAAEEMRVRLAPVRALALELDRLAWQEGRASSAEAHSWLVATSDFNGDFERYQSELAAQIAKSQRRQPYPEDMLRLGYLGVPPIFAPELFSYLESLGARVVFHEVQRQFAMPPPAAPAEGRSLAHQYSRYTYPYSVFHRLGDILPQLRLRRLDGVLHYVQAFCHRGIADIIFRHALPAPILTLEGNADFHLDAHARTRLEAFLDLLRRRQRPGREALSPLAEPGV